MPWFKIDDHVSCHPATARAGNAALGLWLRAGTWMATHGKTDGHIPKALLPMIGSRREARALEDADLWIDVGDHWIMRSNMDIGSCGLPGRLWEVERTDYRRTIPSRLREAIYSRDGHRCLECDSEDDLTLDHIHPWSLGGQDSFDNLRTLCRSCNSRKGARV